MIHLRDRVALVTGGSRGIGAATVRLLVQAGAKVGFSYRTRQSEADALVTWVTGNGGDAMAVQADFASPHAASAVVDAVIQTYGQLDFVIANAGVWPPEDVNTTEMAPERWRRTWSVNVESVFQLIQAAGPALRDDGRIVIVSSTASQRGETGHADYAASKGAVNAMVKSLAGEFAPSINVNAVAPGWVDTEMCDLPYQRDDGAGLRAIEAAIPRGRVATPEEIAGPIVFLCSGLSKHITGEILNVNGGGVLCG